MSYKELIAVLRTERIRRGLTQADVAHRAGYAPVTIGCYEIGHGMPSVDALTRWAQALGYSITLTPGPRNPLEPITASRAAANRRELADALGIPDTTTTGGG